MKPILIIFSLFFSTTTTVAQHFSLFEYEDREGLFKRNKVKELKVIAYADSFKEGLHIASIKYDELGNILSARKFTTNNKQTQFDSLFYNARRKLIKKTSYHHENRLSFDSLVYDEKDSLLLSYGFKWDDSRTIIGYSYSEQGKQVDTKQYNGDTLIFGALTIYDAAGRILNQAFSGRDQVIISAEHVYDSAARLIQRKITDKSGVATTSNQYSATNKLAMQFLEGHGNRSIATYKYDAAGNMTEVNSVSTTSWDKGTSSHKTMIKYDPNNLIIEKRSFVDDKQYLQEKWVYSFY